MDCCHQSAVFHEVSSGLEYCQCVPREDENDVDDDIVDDNDVNVDNAVDDENDVDNDVDDLLQEFTELASSRKTSMALSTFSSGSQVASDHHLNINMIKSSPPST